METSPVSMALIAALQVHREQLVSYVSRIMHASIRSAFDPADVLQDVLYAAMQSADEFAALEVRARLTWLKTVARRRVVRLHESRGCDAAVQFEDVEGLLLEAAVYDRTPSESAMSHEVRRDVARAVRGLPRNYRKAITEKYFEGRTAAEMADRTDSNANAVKQLLHRARTLLREDLARYLPAPA